MVLLLTLALALDLASVRSEPKPEKRSEQALEFADAALDTARDAYQQGKWDETQQALGKVQEAVTLSYESLQETGKDPRDSSKYFKRAEKATRQLLRRLAGLKQIMSSVDHHVLEPVVDNVTEVHDELLMGIMGAN